MVALNDLDTSKRRVEQLESSIQGSLPRVDWAREYYYEMAKELNRDQIHFECFVLGHRKRTGEGGIRVTGRETRVTGPEKKAASS